MADTFDPLDTNWNIIGHAWAVNMLRQHVATDAARHAYLFTGPRGIGRRTLALRFALALNCTVPVQPGMACGQCDDCKRLLRDNHPDVSIIQAEAEGAVLKVEQVRELRRKIVLTPYQARHRVAILSRFQEANDSSANALLKTLEEAPAHAVLILTAESPEGLLPTIVSRCEVVRLQPVPAGAIQRLLETRGADPDKARLLSHISGGCPGAALRLLADPEAIVDREEKLNDLLGLLQAARARRFAYAGKLGRDKASMRETLMVWLSFWRDVLWRASGAAAPIANIDRQAEIESLARRLSLPEATRLVEDLDRAVRRLDSNINTRLLGEVLLLDWPH